MLKQFMRYVLPSTAAFFFSSLYTMIDGFFIGRSAGETGLAAIGIAYPLAALLQAAGTGIGVGGAVQMSICRGRGDRRAEARFFFATLFLLSGAGVLLTAAMIPACRPLLLFLGADGAVLEAAVSYLSIVASGSVFQIYATGFTPLLRNRGDAMRAMLAMISGFCTNIVLDALLVLALRKGVAGAAWATIAGQAVTTGVCLPSMRRAVQEHRKQSAQYWNTIPRLLKTGLSPFGLTMSPNLIMALVNRSTANFGGDALAAYAVAAYVTAVVQCLLQGIGDGSQPLLSLCMGKGEMKKAGQIRNLAYTFSIPVALSAAALVWLLRGKAPALFGASGATAAAAAEALSFFAAGFLPLAFCKVSTSYFYATGKNTAAFILVFGEPAILMVLLTILPHFAGLSGVWLAIPASQAALLTIALFLLRRKPKKRNAARPAAELL